MECRRGDVDRVGAAADAAGVHHRRRVAERIRGRQQSGQGGGGCGESAPDGGPPSANEPPPAPPKTLAEGSNRFGFDLYAKLAKDGNLAVSPASITLALAMTYGGARGETAAQMQKTMHLGGTPDEVMAQAGQLESALTAKGRPLTLRT